MSHFTVLVPAEDEQQLEHRLLPYHEYECTGIEAYVEFVPEDMDELRADFAKHGDGSESFEEWVPHWCGAHQNEAGVWGRRTNPNAKWDWWQIGGRWSGLLVLKPEYVGQGANGHGGLLSPANTDPDRADIVLAGWVDWAAMRQEQIETAKTKWWAWQSLPPKPTGKFDRNDPAWQAWNKALDEKDLLFYIADADHEHDLATLTLEEYAIKHGAEHALTFAYIDQAGQWHGRADMHWFAVTSNPVDTYDQDWWQFVRGLPFDQQLYIVDCHI